MEAERDLIAKYLAHHPQEREKYKHTLEGGQALVNDIVKLEDIQRRKQLTEIRKQQEKNLEPVLHPYKSFAKRLLGITPRPYRYGMESQMGMAPSPTTTQEAQLAGKPSTAYQRYILHRLRKIEDKVNGIYRTVSRELNLLPARVAEPAYFGAQRARDYIWHPQGISQREARMQRMEELQNQLAVIKARMANQRIPPELLPLIEDRDFTAPRQTSEAAMRRTAEVENINSKIEALQHPQLPPELQLKYEAAANPADKLKIYENFYQAENLKVQPEVERLETELYELRHPFITKRLKERGERFILRGGRITHVAPEDMESFYKSGTYSGMMPRQMYQGWCYKDG